MNGDIIAEVTLDEGGGKPSPTESFGFIITFGKESFSSAIVGPSTGVEITIGKPSLVHLKFLFPEAAGKVAKRGTEFTFFDQGRTGKGRVIEVATPNNG